MSSQELAYLSLREAADQVRTRQVSPVDLLDAVRARTETLEPRLNAYITTLFEEAMVAARAAEQAIMAGQYRGPLHGIPVALKDNYWTRGIRTTAGTKILADYMPPEDGTVVAKLREAGAVITGKCNMHEFALGGTTENPHYGPAHNPWHLDRVPGGSSGGSAGATAAGLCYAATGSDTAGSIRNPASYCGLAGIKPTYGRVSIHGIVPLSWSLDHAGPLTRTVEDAALVLNVIAGYDSRDPGSVNLPVPDFTAGLAAGLQGIRLGVPRQFFFEGVTPEVSAAVETALGVFRDLGASVQEVAWPSAGQSLVIFPFVSRPEVVSFQEEFLRTRSQDYGPDVFALAAAGEFVLGADYVRAQRLRRGLRQDLETVLSQVDAIITPTTRSVAFPIGTTIPEIGGMPMNPFNLGVGLTVPFDLTGTPCLSVPCGFSPEGLPIGLHIAGRAWDEATVLRIGAAYEQATSWHQQHPNL